MNSLPKHKYFFIFFSSATEQGKPGRDAAAEIWDLAMVLTQVKSQIKHFPCFQGIRVAPSLGACHRPNTNLRARGEMGFLRNSKHDE